MMPFYVSCMDSILGVYTGNAFPDDQFFEFQNPPMAESMGDAPFIESAMWDGDQFVQLLDNGALDHFVPSDQLGGVNHTYGMQMQTPPGQFGDGNASEMLAWTDNGGEVYLEDGNAKSLDGLHRQELNHFGAEWFDFVEDIESPAFPMPGENWGIQHNQLQALEPMNMKPLKYSEEERKERIQRYMKKKSKRNFKRTIKYECRKTIADKRVRVNGRFAKKSEESCRQELDTKNDNAQNDGN